MPSILQVSGGSLMSGAAVVVTPTGFTDGSSATTVEMPSGDTASRPSAPVQGTLRYNSDTESIEFWTGSGWRALVYSFETAQIKETFSDQSVSSSGSYVLLSVDTTLAPWTTRVDSRTIRITQAGTYLVTVAIILFCQSRTKWDCIVELHDVTVPSSPATLVRIRHGSDLRIDPLANPYVSVVLPTVVSPTANMDLSVWVDPLGFGDVGVRGSTTLATGLSICRLR